tara:strand:- start:3090 stop:3545 length:456 start_codon:yes stop_codon:yes gene_type:complete
MLKPTIAEEVQEKFNIRVKKFREEIKSKYGITLYIASSSFEDVHPLELSKVWDLLFEIVEEFHPQYTKCYKNPLLTREREWMNYMHAYCLIVYRQLHYGPSVIGRFLKKNHASIIHSAKKGGDLLDCEDFDFSHKYHLLLNKVKKNVEFIS